MRNIYYYILIEAGILILAFILKLEIPAITSLQLLVYTLILTKNGDDVDSPKTLDLRAVEKISEYPGNLENLVFKSFSDINGETDCRKIFEKAIHDNINGFPIGKALVKYSKPSDKTIKILMKLVSSLFVRDASSVKKVLETYIIILKENEILKNERRNIFSEARFRARIMLIVSALLMGFLSATGPVIHMFSSFSSKPILQLEASQTFSLFTYLLSVSILVHYSLSYKKLLKTLLYSITSFALSFLIFNKVLTAFLF
ncbi:MAG: hypothetical protein FGF52_00160 [Candidatus Brockarchaeota archaeon]|nr:hypothetical protein [Candidatus Brockarchaeota archaeon]